METFDLSSNVDTLCVVVKEVRDNASGMWTFIREFWIYTLHEEY
jgi:hypothetical protein